MHSFVIVIPWGDARARNFLGWIKEIFVVLCVACTVVRNDFCVVWSWPNFGIGIGLILFKTVSVPSASAYMVLTNLRLTFV